MSRAVSFGALLGLLLVASAATARGEDAVWYARRISVGETPLRVEHFWSRGSNLRSHTVLAGHPVVTLVVGDRYLILDELSLKGIAIRRHPRAIKHAKSGERPFGNDAERIVREGGEKVRSERLAGAMCDLYRITNARGRQEVWVTQEEPRLPLRVVVFDRASGRSARNDYLDWSQSVAVPPAFFEPDPRFEIERIEYEDYLTRSTEGPVGPAPVLYSDLLHGR